MSPAKPRRISRMIIGAVLATVAVTVTGLFATLVVNDLIYVFIGICTAALVIVLVLAVERMSILAVNAVAKAGKQTQIVTHEQTAILARVEARNRRMETVLNNTAGSVGRSSPIVRRIEASVQGLSSELITSAKPLGVTGGNNQPGPGRSVASSSLPSFPEAPEVDTRKAFAETTVLMIADEFTLRAFSHEWTVVTATPNDWRSVIETKRPSLVFVESAWEANGGTWKYHLVGPSAPRKPIIELTTYCRDQGIPTVFWNKEDPPHFEDFLDTARLFDHVFTTDGDKVAEYRSRLGHDRVQLLAFAAQPAIHNPGRVRGVERSRAIVFGGMYFRDKYPERRRQMDILLPAAEKLGLDIFSRNSGDDGKYRFPERFSTSIRPGIPYRQMISAYHGYKVVINVNSVTDSSSMCARRVFEATACGAAVVTTPTPAIKRFFGDDLLTLIEDEPSAYDRMRTLVRSDELRARRVHLAQRRIWESDTYAHRALEVMSAVGIEAEAPAASCSVVVCTNRPNNLPQIVANYQRQILSAGMSDLELVLVTHGFTVDQVLLRTMLRDGRSKSSSKASANSIKVIETSADASLGEILNRGFDAARGGYLFRMDDDDHYGANYVRDQLNAIHFSGADLVGKAETYMYFEGEDATFLTFPGKSHRDTDFIRGATFAGPRRTFSKYRFKERRSGEDSDFISQLRRAGGRIYSSDRFNYVVNRHADKTRHTWAAADANLMGTGEMKFVGNDPRQIEI